MLSAPVGTDSPQTIIKRDGRVVPFDVSRIEYAIHRCLASLGVDTKVSSEDLAQRVLNIVCARYGSEAPTVENIQDIVEMVLQAAGEYDAAKHYILYRAAHAKERAERPIPAEVRQAFDDSSLYFPTQLQQFQFFDKYSRFNYETGRRETWIETVTRAVDYMYELAGDRLESEVYQRIKRSILEMRTMPSMRLLAMAGAAARRQNISIYNCSYIPVDCVDAFCEALLISMSGCGVGFSVEGRYVEQFPRIRRQIGSMSVPTHVVEDTTEGWVNAVRLGLNTWINGEDVNFDFSQVRPAGAVLVVKGGRASGPEPLRRVLEFARRRILARQGSFIRTIDAHDIMCAVGDCAVSGGTRRTAMLSLFDFDDADMLRAKHGDFEKENSQRWNANNSAVWPDEGLTQTAFMRQFLQMIESERGEPGIFHRKTAQLTIPARRAQAVFGTNPCGEIFLRPLEFCNLSAVVARREDTLEDLRDKVEVATIIGTIQSLATHFPGLRDDWKRNCDEERLLGVDITGQMDCPAVQDAGVKEGLRYLAVEANRLTARALGINQSAGITCVKPSGNTSQLVNCSSGLHARMEEYYIRNVRVSTHTPLFKVLRDSGVPMDPENGQTREDASTWVIHFPMKSPDGAVIRGNRSAVEQCEYWLQNKLHWTEHNPSVTITYRPDEVIDLTKWVWDHHDLIGGMAFLPVFDAQYAQLPYVRITKDEYERLHADFPPIDFARLYRYESEDWTTAAQELACTSGSCDLD